MLDIFQDSLGFLEGFVRIVLGSFGILWDLKKKGFEHRLRMLDIFRDPFGFLVF